MNKAQQRVTARQARVLELDKQGVGPMDAAAMLNTTPETIYKDRIALGLAERRQGNYGASSQIDLGLAVLSVVNRTGEPLTLDQIAGPCECTREAIRQIEYKALKKLRNACPELREFLGEVA